MTDKPAPGEGPDSDTDSAFDGPTVRTPVPSVDLRAFQENFPGPGVRVNPGDTGGVPSGMVDDGGPTVPNSGTVALSPPPVMPNLLAGGVLGHLGEDRWAGGEG